MNRNRIENGGKIFFEDYFESSVIIVLGYLLLQKRPN